MSSSVIDSSPLTRESSTASSLGVVGRGTLEGDGVPSATSWDGGADVVAVVIVFIFDAAGVVSRARAAVAGAVDASGLAWTVFISAEISVVSSGWLPDPLLFEELVSIFVTLLLSVFSLPAALPDPDRSLGWIERWSAGPMASGGPSAWPWLAVGSPEEAASWAGFGPVSVPVIPVGWAFPSGLTRWAGPSLVRSGGLVGWEGDDAPDFGEFLGARFFLVISQFERLRESLLLI